MNEPPPDDRSRPAGGGNGETTRRKVEFKVTRIAGLKTLVVLLPVPDDAPAEIREGLARRNIVNRGGTCPCGAVATVPNRAERRRRGGVVSVQILHEDDCPATDENIRPALAAWQATR
jgi:hypothetical protein